MQITHSQILLDACCVINFCASGQFLAILKSLSAESDRKLGASRDVFKGVKPVTL